MYASIATRPNPTLLSLTLLSRGTRVREYHLVAARQIADGFGIMDASAFDLLLMRKAFKDRTALLSVAK